MATDTTIDATLIDAGLEAVAVRGATSSQIMVLDFDGEPVELRALLAERRHWREWATCHIGLLTRALDGDRALRCHLKGMVKTPQSVLIELLCEVHAGLQSAVEGEYFARCEGCGRQIWPDEVQIPYSDVSCHASCDGSVEIKAGDQIPVDPDAIDDELLEPGEPKPTHVTAFVDQPLFTDAQIRECVADAGERLKAAGRI